MRGDNYVSQDKIKEELSTLDDAVQEYNSRYLALEEKGSFQLFAAGSTECIPGRRSKDDAFRLKYECSWPGCPKKFFSKTGLKFHTNKHKNVFPYNCEQCGKGFNRSCEYDDHINMHAGNFWKCSICGAILKSQHGRRVHEAQHANQQLPCDICGKLFPCRDYLNAHLRAHNSSFECNVCKKVFKRKHHYKEHIKVHEKDGFHCEFCDFVTNYAQSLKRHLRNSHNPEKIEYQTCKNCGKTFNRHDFLMKHIEKCRLKGKGLWDRHEIANGDQSQVDITIGTVSDTTFSLKTEFPQLNETISKFYKNQMNSSNESDHKIVEIESGSHSEENIEQEKPK